MVTVTATLVHAKIAGHARVAATLASSICHADIKRKGGFRMKNKLKLFGLIAMVAVMGLTFAACGGDDDGGGGGGGGSNITLTVKNNYNGTIKRVVLSKQWVSGVNESIINGLESSNILFDTGKDKLNIVNGAEEKFSVNIKGNSKLYLVIVYSHYSSGRLTTSAATGEMNVSPGKKYTAQFDTIAASGWPIIHYN
jgi:hypothetical protein